MNKILFIFCMMLFTQTLSANGNYAVRFTQLDQQAWQIEFDLLNYQVEEEGHGGVTYSVINYHSGMETEKKGWAQMPFNSIAVQLPPLHNMDISVTQLEYEDINLNHPMLPSRGVIYRNQDPEQVPYEIDPASITDSWYPGQTAVNGRPFILRDVRGTSIKIFPVQYNAVRQIVRIHKKLLIELVESETPPENPFINPVNGILRDMDQLYRSVFINYSPEMVSGNRDALSIEQNGAILVITTARDEDAIEPLIQWKREKGFTVYKEVADAGTNVKDLIQQSYNQHNDILYVQLVGDWADLKSDLGTSENAPMDPQLGCVAGDDYFADICIGRISAGSPQEVTVQVDKIIAYEQNPETGSDWYASATGIASDEGSGDDGEYDYEHMDVIWNDKLSLYTYEAYNSVYEPSATKAMISDAVNSGTGIINYTGHGSSTSWGTTGFNNTDVTNLTNGSRMPVIFAVACLNGSFHNSSDCFAEAWLKNENGGAVAMLASTINQPWDPPMRGQDYFNDVLTGGYDYDAHPSQSGINTNEQRSTFGSIVFNGLTLMLTESDAGSDLETVQTWSIFGDPSMEIRTAAPAEIMLSNEVVMQAVPFETIVSSGSPVADAWVTLSQDGHYFSGISDVNGMVSIEHTLVPGPAKLVVTGFNKETIYRDIVVVSSDGPYVVVDSCVVNDFETGNGNRMAEFGEQTWLNIYAHNIGTDTAYQVQAVLKSEDPYIALIDTVFALGDIDTAVGVFGEMAFRVQVADDVPDQYSIPLEFSLTDDSSNTWVSRWNLLVNAPNLQLGELLIDDSEGGNNDGKLDAGETADILIQTINNGHAPAADPASELSTGSQYLTINSASIMLDTLNAGESVYAIFNVTAEAGVPLGSAVPVFNHVQSINYSVTDTFNLVIGDIPVYNMQDNTVTCNHGLFFDSGGEHGQYNLRERFTLTFLPEENSPALKAIFSAFDVESNDELHVYDGTSTGAPEFPGSPFTGSTIPPTVTATNPQGALTFYFTSNLRDNANGWKAEIITDAVSDIGDASIETVWEFMVYPNFPNPFNPSTTIRYQIPKEETVYVQIYNMLGQKVRTLLSGKQKQGIHELKWDGRNDVGNVLPTGIYLLNVEAGTFKANRKLLLIK